MSIKFILGIKFNSIQFNEMCTLDNLTTRPTPSHFMIPSSQQVWSAAELLNLSELSLAGGLYALTRSRLSGAKPGTAAHPVKLDSDKLIGHEAARLNRWLD